MNDNQLTFIEIQNFDYSLEILEWRNDELTRKNSINENIINQNDHELWLKSKIDSNDTLLLIYFYNSEPCALIKLDKLDKGKFGISINLNPNLDNFKGINPCGNDPKDVTSLEEIGLKNKIKKFDQVLLKNFSTVFDITLKSKKTLK